MSAYDVARPRGHDSRRSVTREQVDKIYDDYERAKAKTGRCPRGWFEEQAALYGVAKTTIVNITQGKYG